jgi:hypothetical protein
MITLAAGGVRVVSPLADVSVWHRAVTTPTPARRAVLIPADSIPPSEVGRIAITLTSSQLATLVFVFSEATAKRAAELQRALSGLGVTWDVAMAGEEPVAVAMACLADESGLAVLPDIPRSIGSRWGDTASELVRAFAELGCARASVASVSRMLGVSRWTLDRRVQAANVAEPRAIIEAASTVAFTLALRRTDGEISIARRLLGVRYPRRLVRLLRNSAAMSASEFQRIVMEQKTERDAVAKVLKQLDPVVLRRSHRPTRAKEPGHVWRWNLNEQWG